MVITYYFCNNYFKSNLEYFLIDHVNFYSNMQLNSSNIC